MRILHVLATLALEWGGPPKAAVELASALADRGHSVGMLASDIGGPMVPLQRARRAGVDIQTFRGAWPLFWYRSAGLVKALRAEVARADVVHLHSLYFFHDLVTYLFCRRYGVPYILWPHGSLDPFIRRRHRYRKKLLELAFQDRVTKGAAAIHYTTEDDRRLASRYVFGRPGFVAPIGIDADEFSGVAPGAFRAMFPAVGGRRIVLFLGRLNFKKGVDILVQALAQLGGARDDICLVLAGPDGGVEQPIRRLVARLGFQDRVIFTGMLQGEAKAAALRDADVFVLPSHSENFGIAVIEALAAKLPVVLSDKVNLYSDLEAAGAGVICSLEPENVAACIARVLDHPDEAARMVAAGYALVKTKYDWAAIGAQLEAVYEQVVRDAARQRVAGGLRDSGLTQSSVG